MHPAIQSIPAWASPWPGNRIIKGLPEDQYHDTKGLVSKSALDVFAQSPMHYHHSLGVFRDAPTDAMKQGSAFHCLTLEPDLWREKVAMLPAGIERLPMQSSTNRGVRDAWIADEARGKIVLKSETFNMVQAMATAVRTHPAARKLLRVGDPEVTAIWTDPQTGLRCKLRADWFSGMAGVFADLKSTVRADAEWFKRTCVLHRYHVQDAFYSGGIDHCGEHIEHFVFIAVESEPPHAVAVYQLDESAKLKGEQLYMKELAYMRECIDADRWPGYPDNVQNLTLPAWATQTDIT